MTEPQSDGKQEQFHEDAQPKPTGTLPEETRQDLQAKPPSGHGNEGESNHAPSNPPPPPVIINIPPPERNGLSITDWITAVSTLVIMVWAGLQWYEMHTGGADTRAIATAARQQACAAKQIAQASERNAKAAEGFATSAGRISDGVGDAVKKLEAQAKATQRSAGAAKSAANTAIQALHISERAYIVTGEPILDSNAKNIVLPIINSGRIPSGKVMAIIHEAAIPVSVPGGPEIKIVATEVHWKHYELESVPTTGTVMNFNIPTPALNAEDVNGGHQQIIIVGVLAYNDGFSGEADQHWPFCYGNAMLPQSKSLQWVICDPNLYLREAIEADHYPQNESK